MSKLSPKQIEVVVAKLSDKGLLKTEKGTKTEWRTVTRGDKTFKQRFRVGQKEVDVELKEVDVESKEGAGKPDVTSYDDIINNVTVEFDKLLAGGKSHSEAVVSFIGRNMKTKGPEIKYGDGTRSAQQSFWMLKKFVSSDYDDELKVDASVAPPGVRSSASGNSVSLDVDSNKIRNLVFHEVGHVIERCGYNSRATYDFMTKRTKDDKIVMLSDIFPNSGYSPEERTYTDNFIHPYVGKIYGGSNNTELVSMGLEQLAEPGTTRKFYNNDKEHFMLIMAIMAGKFIKGVK